MPVLWTFSNTKLWPYLLGCEWHLHWSLRFRLHELCSLRMYGQYSAYFSPSDLTWNMLLPSEFNIITHWSKWWCSIVLVVYRIASGDSVFVWNALFVPRWSRSWHKHATKRPKISKSVIKRSILPVFNIANIVCATLRAWRQLWYLTGR